MSHQWVIMPVLGAPELTEAAIDDVLAQSVAPNLLIVNQGVDQAFRERLERIAEYYTSRVFVWSHQPPLPSLAATWNRALDFCWAIGCEEALVVNNDVRLHQLTLEVLSELRTGLGALFITAVGVTAGQFDATDTDADVWAKLGPAGNLPQGGPDFSCFLISQAGHTRYRFDEGFVPAYCEDLDTHRRYILGGDGDKIFSVNLPYHHVGGGSGTLKAMTSAERAAHEARIGQSRDYYQRKWGGPVNHERWTIPFDAATDQDGVTTPELQAPPATDPTVTLTPATPDDDIPF